MRIYVPCGNYIPGRWSLKSPRKMVAIFCTNPDLLNLGLKFNCGLVLLFKPRLNGG